MTTRAPASVSRAEISRRTGAVVIRQPERGVEHQFGEIVFQQRHASGDVAGRVVDMQRLPLGQRRMGLERNDNPFRGLRRRVGQQPVAAVKLVFFGITGNIQRDTLPGVGLFHRLVFAHEARARASVCSRP